MAAGGAAQKRDGGRVVMGDFGSGGRAVVRGQVQEVGDRRLKQAAVREGVPGACVQIGCRVRRGVGLGSV